MKIMGDIFPARARVIPNTTPVDYTNPSVTMRYAGSRMVDAVRVVISSDTVMIAADSSDGPMLIFREKYDPNTLVLDRTGRTVTTLVTVTGKTVFLEKDNNCGCGSRLRAWNPYNTLYAGGDQTE